MGYMEDRMKRKNGLLPPLPTRKEKKPLKRQSEKKKQEIADQKAKGTDVEMDLFFDAMLKRCTGKCLFCNSKTTAVDASFWRDDNPRWSEEANEKNHERRIEMMRRASIAHLFPKRPIEKGGFPSVGTHEDNWIELCWSCHTQFDTGKITWEFIRDSAEWIFIIEKLLNVLPLVAEEERKHKLYSKLNNLVYGR